MCSCTVSPLNDGHCVEMGMTLLNDTLGMETEPSGANIHPTDHTQECITWVPKHQ